MRLIAAVKVYNEAYYLDEFIRYNLDIGFDELHFFDSASSDGTREAIEAWALRLPGRVRLIRSSAELRHSSYSRETEVCNLVLAHAMQTAARSDEGLWCFFLDADEFLEFGSGGLRRHLEASPHRRVRVMFYDWYLSPEQAARNPPAAEVIAMLRRRELKGRILEVYGDPYYKDYGILLSGETLPGLRGARTVAGNHRLLIDGQVHVPPNESCLVCNHLRGVAKRVTMSRIDERMELLKKSNDEKSDHWTYVHFDQVKSELADYDGFYASLVAYDELERARGRAADFDNEASVFNQLFY